MIQDGADGLPDGLKAFLEAGPPPVVFTLGSSAVFDPGRFYEQGAAAASWLGKRAVLLTGRDPNNQPRKLPPGVAAFDYAPYSKLFPRSCVVVHQGGIGTTAQAMRAGVPMLVMPYSHDQPDNADRVVRLGIGRSIPRGKFRGGRVVKELRILINEPSYSAKAAAVGKIIEKEDGAKCACDALEQLLRQKN